MTTENTSLPSAIQLELDRYHNMPEWFHPDLHAFIASALENRSPALCRAAFEAAKRWMNDVGVPEYELPASNNNGEQRSKPGSGEKVFVYVVGLAADFADSIVPAFGKISAGCGPNLREDFARCRWPVVVKVKMGISDSQLVRHLRDLADSIKRHPERRSKAGGGKRGNLCSRCGADEQATHHPLCQYRDGTPTELSDKEVMTALRVLTVGGAYAEEATDDIPF